MAQYFVRRALLARTAALGGSGAASMLSGRRVLAAGPAPKLVALDWSLIEIALTLGIVPMAATETAGYRAWVREPALPPDVVDLGLRLQPNLELLRMLDPALILTIPERADIALALASIAPTLDLPIYTDRHDPYALACAATRKLADAVGRPQAGEAAVVEAEAAIAAARARLSADEPPILLIRFVNPRTIYIFGPGGLFDAMLGKLGLVNGWRGPPTNWGFVQASLAALAQADPRSRLVILGPPLAPDIRAMMRQDPLWRSLPFVRRGALDQLPPVWFFGAIASATRFASLLAQALVDGAGHAG